MLFHNPSTILGGHLKLPYAKKFNNISTRIQERAKNLKTLDLKSTT